MQIAIKKWGNSQGIIISKEMMDLLGTRVGDELEASVEEDRLILTKRFKHKTLEERMEETGLPLKFGPEIEWGESKGSELW